jgi:hypothetical protein
MLNDEIAKKKINLKNIKKTRVNPLNPKHES